MNTLFSFVFITISGTFNYFLTIYLIDGMKTYEWYVTEISLSIIGFFLFFLMYIYLIIKKKQTIKKNQVPFMMMGIMDSLSTFLNSMSTPYLTIASMTILDKLKIPLLMLFSYIIINKRYIKQQYLGMFLILYAIMVPYIPNINRGRFGNQYYILVFIISLIPNVYSYISKEKYMKNHEIHPIEINVYISFWQSLFGFVFVPFLFIKELSQVETIVPNHFVQYLSHATQCQFHGIDVVGHSEQCKWNLYYLLLSLCISNIINIYMMYVLQHQSSVLFIVINCLRIPIQAVLGSFRIIAGENYGSFNISYLFSFVLMSVGMFIYYNVDTKKNRENLYDSIEYNYSSIGEDNTKDKKTKI